MTSDLEKRLAELNAEIRRYPGPIARCDEQLAALLEERSKLILQSEVRGCSAEALWTNDGGPNAA